MATQSFPTPAATDPIGVAILSHLVDRTDAVRARFSGATAPATTVPYQAWADTTTGMMRIRNAANTAWIDVHPLAFQPKLIVPLQLSGALGAGELQMVVPHAATVARILMVANTTTTGSDGSNRWQWQLSNETQTEDLFAAAPTTDDRELTADTAYVLSPDQNQAVDASDVLRLAITQTGAPTAVSYISIALELAPRGS